MGLFTLKVEAPDERKYLVRWRQVRLAESEDTIAVVVLERSTEAERVVSVVRSQRIRIEELLIRQTLIEEEERRRLGRTIHDGIVQDLALLRAECVRLGGAAARLLPGIDALIDASRELMCESAPIIDDQGLRPALGRLAEHLSRRYGCRVRVADDWGEPALSQTVRTVVLRGVRELAVNAVKHSESADVMLSCAVDDHAAHITVSDSGRGFSASEVGELGNGRGYGLLSVEQQVQGLGGSFELVSKPNDGTHATISVPLRGKGEADG